MSLAALAPGTAPPRTSARRARRDPLPAQRDAAPGRTRRPRRRPSSTSSTRCYPQFFSRAELAYRRRVYGWTVQRSRLVITISRARAANAARAATALDPDARAHDPPRRRPRTLHAGRAAARAVPPLPRQRAGRTRTTRACSRRSRCVRRERPELRLVLTGAGPRRADAAGRRRVARARVRSTSSSSCTGAPPRSSSRACTRASGCPCSRRWRAAARSRPRTSPRCRRSAATRPSTSTRARSSRSRTGSRDVLDRPTAREALERAARVHLGRVRPPARRGLRAS